MITKIEAENFRGRKSISLEFGANINYIKGPNESGKSSVKELLCYGFYGVDSTGAKNPEHLISDKEDKSKVVITTDKVSIVRTKKRGGQPTIKLLRAGAPEIKMTQGELTELLGISFEVFASCFLVGFFSDLPKDKQAEVLGVIAKIDRKTLLAQMLGATQIPAKVKLLNPRLDAQSVATERRQLQNMMAGDVGALAQVEATIQETKPVEDAGDTQTNIDAIKAKLSLFDIYNRELNLYRMQTSRTKELKEHNSRLASEKEKVELAIKALGNRPCKIERQTIRDLIDKHNGELSLLSRSPMPNKPVLPEDVGTDPICSRCGQQIPEKLKEVVAAAREQLINQYNKDARAVEDFNNQVALKERGLRDTIQELTNTGLNYDKAEFKWVSDRNMLMEKLKSLVEHPIIEAIPPVVPEGDETQLREQLSILQGLLFSQQHASSRHETAIRKRSALHASITERERIIGELKKVEEALLALPNVEVSEVSKRLAIPNVQIQYEDGELKVANNLGIPYQLLSAGRRIKTDLLLAAKFQSLVARAPKFYFVDNADLVDDIHQYLPQASQVFIAKVDPSLTMLEVVQM
jgi:DNA repair exonuclease SbcCD ATPase subunit